MLDLLLNLKHSYLGTNSLYFHLEVVKGLVNNTSPKLINAIAEVYGCNHWFVTKTGSFNRSFWY
jgi:hypothetical protein